MVMEPAGPAGPPLGDLSLHHLLILASPASGGGGGGGEKGGADSCAAEHEQGEELQMWVVLEAGGLGESWGVALSVSEALEPS